MAKHEYSPQADIPVIPPSQEVEAEMQRLYAAKGESARHSEIKQRIENAMGSVDRLQDVFLNHLLATEPHATDERLADLLSQAVNRHKAPAIFAVRGAYQGASTTRAYTSVRMGVGQFMTPDSLRVARRLDEEDGQKPAFTVELDFKKLKVLGEPTTAESFATAIFTDFGTYGDEPVPDFLYNGDRSRGEGGWVANAQQLEGLVDQQFEHIGIPKDWDK